MPTPQQLADNYRFLIDDYHDIAEALQLINDDVTRILKQKKAALRATQETNAPTGDSSQAELTPSRMSTRSSSIRSLTQANQVGTPNKTPSYKRKVSFPDSLAEEEEEDFPLETPSKRQKFSSPSTFPSMSSPSKLSQTSSRPPSNDEQTNDVDSTPTASTSRSSLNPSEIAASDGDEVNTSIANRVLASRIASTTIPTPGIPGPSTPRRRRTTAQPQSGSAIYRSGGKTPAQISLLEQQIPRRRYRPVFSDQSQWCQKDPRLESQNKRAEELAKSMMEKFGRALTVA